MQPVERDTNRVTALGHLIPLLYIGKPSFEVSPSIHSLPRSFPAIRRPPASFFCFFSGRTKMGSKEILIVAVVVAMIMSPASSARLLVDREEAAVVEPALHLAFWREGGASASSGDDKMEAKFLLLSSLPKGGRVPPSGPSKRTNNLIS
ncbi:hypothetical protein ACJRO7_007072 [Eucalyptus globulus]|uniref:Uncharacterized protein n=1 Tax=Eucalyptus globulus TaxID=34317 RepID=A0ABD3ILH9_EUCGL